MSAGTALIVDDDAAVRLVTSEMLKRIDWVAESAQTGAQALEKLGTGVFDVVFLDLAMPDMGGDEVYAQVRQSYPGQHVVFMTGYSKEELEDLDNPCTWVLTKPFTLRNLTSLLEQVGVSGSR